jgi:hypothetical protein
MILTIPENLRAQIADSVDVEGNRMVDLTQFAESYNDSFQFDFVEVGALGSQERKILDTTAFVIEAFGGKPTKVDAIKISNTMRPDLLTSGQTLGCWDPTSSSIVIWRPQLRTFEDFSSVLIHELVHAKTGYSDVTRDFESALTTTIGDLCLGWWNSSNKKTTSQNSVDVQATTSDTAEKNEGNQTATNEELTTMAALRQVELDQAYETIAQLKAINQASEATVFDELQKTKKSLANQLDDALNTIESLSEELGLERQKSIQARNESEAIQTDMKKLQAIQSGVPVEPATPKPAVKPWYRLW